MKSEVISRARAIAATLVLTLPIMACGAAPETSDDAPDEETSEDAVTTRLFIKNQHSSLGVRGLCMVPTSDEKGRLHGVLMVDSQYLNLVMKLSKCPWVFRYNSEANGHIAVDYKGQKQCLTNEGNSIRLSDCTENKSPKDPQRFRILGVGGPNKGLIWSASSNSCIGSHGGTAYGITRASVEAGYPCTYTPSPDEHWRWR